MNFTYIKRIAFVLAMCYTIHMIDKPILETAEMRAKRIWRNQQMLRKMVAENTTQETTVTYEPSRVAQAFRKAVLEVFTTNKNNKIQMYIAALKHQKRRLLIEKIKRLERDNGD
jgi:hypothetical protein